jgi:hypothetical protein
MKREPIGDLQLLFLRLIAEETPDAAAVLFSLRDAGEWMEHYGVFADWLETFLRAVLEQGQEHIDWVVKNRETFGQASFWSRPRKRPAKQPPMRLAQAEAWLRTLTGYEGKQAEWRVMSQVFPERITYSDPTIDKRDGEKHCLSLVQWLFERKPDASSHLGKERRKFAREIGLKLKRQPGRRQ